MKKSKITILFIILGIVQIAFSKDNPERIFDNKFVSIFTIENVGEIKLKEIPEKINLKCKMNNNVIVLLMNPGNLFTKDPDYLENTIIVVIEFK